MYNIMCVNFDGVTLEVFDYYHAETVASFSVLRIEDTDEEISLEWTNL